MQHKTSRQGRGQNVHLCQRSLPFLAPMASKDLEITKRDLHTVVGVWEEDEALAERLCSVSVSDPKDYTPLMTAVKSKLSDYYDKKYSSKQTFRFTVQKKEDSSTAERPPDGAMIVRSYIEHLEVSNQRTASWATVWSIHPDKETEAEIFGTAQIHLHYYENGTNVQLRARKFFPVDKAATAVEQVNSIVAQMEARTMSYEDKVAKAVVKQITKHENELYDHVKELCDEMIDGHLKKMRRVLPITKTRFKWDAAAQKQVKLLNERNTA